LQVCHGVMPWQEQPYGFPSLRRFVAVDDAVEAHLVEQGLDADGIAVIRTAVDLTRFQLRPRIASRPRKALVFGGRGYEAGLWLEVQKVCRSVGVEQLDEVGQSVGGAFSCPEKVLPRYDLVFAKGRAAHEAAATGAAVLVGDDNRMAGLLTPARFDAWRPLNFGFRTFDHEVTTNRLRSELEQYHPDEIRSVAERVRSEAALSDVIDQWESLYEEVAAERSLVRAIPEPEMNAAVSALARAPQWEPDQPLPPVSTLAGLQEKLSARARRRWRLHRKR
jgi:hypothetical protein